MNWADLASMLGMDAKTYSSTKLLNELCRRLGESPTVGRVTTPQASSADDPQADFEKLATLYAKTHSVSLGEAYSRVSEECPTLYERATNRARLN
jgi:hypothetical protein